MKAVEHASKAVRQLGSLLFEMEVLRSFLETRTDLKYFDTRVKPAKLLAQKAVEKLKGKNLNIQSQNHQTQFQQFLLEMSLKSSIYLTLAQSLAHVLKVPALL